MEVSRYTDNLDKLIDTEQETIRVRTRFIAKVVPAYAVVDLDAPNLEEQYEMVVEAFLGFS